MPEARLRAGALREDDITPEWIRRLMQAIRPYLPQEFVGQIEINVFRGGISNVNVKQSFKDQDQHTQTTGGSGHGRQFSSDH